MTDTTPVVTVPKTLAEILAFLDAVDQGLIAVTPEAQAEVGALLVAKIDNTAEVIDELEHQEMRLRTAAKKLTDGAKQVKNRVERIQSYIAHHMQVNGFQQLPGDVWKAKLNTGLSAEPNYKVPVKGDFAERPDLVRVKYEWDKVALKKALEALDEFAMQRATLELSASVSIVANKGRLA